MSSRSTPRERAFLSGWRLCGAILETLGTRFSDAGERWSSDRYEYSDLRSTERGVRRAGPSIARKWNGKLFEVGVVEVLTDLFTDCSEVEELGRRLFKMICICNI